MAGDGEDFHVAIPNVPAGAVCTRRSRAGRRSLRQRSWWNSFFTPGGRNPEASGRLRAGALVLVISRQNACPKI
jgi:hypothetical protein